jgi:hypothetical protein ELI_2404
MGKYLLRLDDACDTMNLKKWSRIEEILDKYKILPLIALIPNNRDKNMIKQVKIQNFECIIERWKNKGWEIGQHGYDHCYLNSCGGINPVNFRSEFAGVSLEKQLEKIQLGKKIMLEKYNIESNIFIAPSHTFDENTIIALKKNNIFKISDGKFLYPYKYKDVVFIPQQVGDFRKIIFSGIWTFCYHPNEMQENDFKKFEKFLEKNKDKFITFKDIDLTNLKEITKFESLFSKVYFFLKSLKRKIT